MWPAIWGGWWIISEAGALGKARGPTPATAAFANEMGAAWREASFGAHFPKTLRSARKAGRLMQPRTFCECKQSHLLYLVAQSSPYFVGKLGRVEMEAEAERVGKGELVSPSIGSCSLGRQPASPSVPRPLPLPVPTQ